MIEFRLITHGSPDYLATIEMRDRILREPLGLSFSEAELAEEKTHWHLGAFDLERDCELVACLVLTPLENHSTRMRQVAVRESLRGTGIGKRLVRFSEDFAREQGIRTMILNAREPVVPFYEKLGYLVTGEPFVEVTLPHRRMQRSLSQDEGKQQKRPPALTD